MSCETRCSAFEKSICGYFYITIEIVKKTQIYDAEFIAPDKARREEVISKVS